MRRRSASAVPARGSAIRQPETLLSTRCTGVVEARYAARGGAASGAGVGMSSSRRRRGVRTFQMKLSTM